MSERRAAWLLVLASMLGMAIAIALGVGYASRHSQREGFFRVRVADAGPSWPGWTRPRRTVLVVVDGLGHIEAERMSSLAVLAREGQCRTTHVGPLSVSRPVYAVISTGLEQDRTGVRANDLVAPIAAESIWDVARRAGMRVSGVSELPWWRELFPEGFDAYVTPPRADDYVQLAPPADLQLIHPVYVDETGHASGAASPAYAESVARADREIAELLATLDLSRDLVIVTADHGESLRGGHGGRQDRVARVRTCFAGRGVRHLEEAGPILSTTLAPTLALLLGLPFPSDMRAGDDELDVMFAIADERAFPAGMFDERRATLARFREENVAALRRWDPASAGSWTRFRSRARRVQALRGLGWLALAIPMVVAHARTCRRRRARAWPGWLLVLGLFGAMLATQLLVRGSFDLTSVSTSEDFLVFTIGMALLWSGVAAAVHVRARASLSLLALDWTLVSSLGTLACLAHPVTFGWSLGYPAPPPELFFFPYFATLVLCPVHLTGVVIGALAGRASAPA